jgi:hypothetical protein
MRAKSFEILLVVCVLLGVACVTVRVVDFPPPENPCPTQADIEELARLLPQPKGALGAIHIDELALKFVDAASYCQVAEKRLR